MELKKQVQRRGFTGTDWGSNPNGRKSRFGYAFTLCGGTISWLSKNQGTIALSSTEAEYTAASIATQEAI